jgi:hypothetical protein
VDTVVENRDIYINTQFSVEKENIQPVLSCPVFGLCVFSANTAEGTEFESKDKNCMTEVEEINAGVVE